MYFDSIKVLTVLRYAFVRKAQDFSLPVDTYNNWAILLTESGAFEYSLGSLHGQADYGDILLCPPRTSVKRRALAPITFHFAEFVIDPSQERDQGGLVSVVERERLRSSLGLLSETAASPEEVRNLRAAHFVRDILYLCDPACCRRDMRSGDPLIANVCDVLRNGAFDHISLREVAADAALSPVQLVRRFRSATGQTPREFVESIRLERARSLLVETDFVLEHIAQVCGYQSAFYLSRLFKQRFGISPSVFRNRSRI